MFTSMTMQPKTIRMNAIFKPTNVPSQTLLLKPHKTPKILSFKPKTSFSTLQTTNTLKLSASGTDSTLTQDHETPTNREKLKVVVKPMQKPRIVLKMIWMDKTIGIALNQVIPGHGTIPLSPYYFWPKQDAWEQLKLFLEAKPWISQRQMAILLNQATDIINLWQDSGKGL